MNKSKNFALFGKNIEYSKSAYINKLFSNEFNYKISYILYECDENNFYNKFEEFFFDKNSIGANITIPFKESVINKCDVLYKNVNILKSVNTVKKKYNNLLFGYNTDGIGLITDLKRLNFIDKDFNVLLIGSGGAAKGIILELLKNSKKVFLTNRTISKANKIKKILKKYNKYNNIDVINFNNIDNNIVFDLIINSTSSSSKDENLNISSKIIRENVKCYDLFYNINEDTNFIKWCKKNGSKNCSDGLGMLIYQASYSFEIWHNKFPNTDIVFKKIKS